MSTIQNYNEIIRGLKSRINMREEVAKVLKSFKILYKKNGEEFATISRKGFDVVGGDNVRVYDEGAGFYRVSLMSYIVDFRVKTYKELREQVQNELQKTEQSIIYLNEQIEQINNTYDEAVKEIEKFYNKIKDNPAAKQILNCVICEIQTAANLDTIDRRKERAEWLENVSECENIEELKEDFKKDINAGYKNGETLRHFTYQGEHELEFNKVLFINNNYYTINKKVKKGIHYGGNLTKFLYKNNVVAVNIDKLNGFNNFCWLSHLSDFKLNELREKAKTLFKKCNALKKYNFDDESVFISSGSVHGFYFPNIQGVDCIAFIEKYGHYYPIILKVC